MRTYGKHDLVRAHLSEAIELIALGKSSNHMNVFE